jgi:hypothetical protein
MTNVHLPPIFTQEEQEQNEICKQRLLDLVASKQALLVVGAGSSAFVEHKTWPKLLEKLEELAISCGDEFVIDGRKRADEPLVYAQNIKDHIMHKTDNLDKYHNLIHQEYSPRNPPFNDFHRTLVSLPFKGILTTNYDIVLESALSEKEPQFASDNYFIVKDNPRKVSEFFLSLDDNISYHRRVAHLHGKYDDSESIVLSLKDYIDCYALKPTERESKLLTTAPSWSLPRKVLWATLATRAVVFIGFGWNDLYLNTTLQFVCNDLWRWKESVHYAVMSIDQQKTNEAKMKAEKLLEDYGVCVVFYENLDNSHLGLIKIVEEMKEKCHLGPASVWMDEATKQMIKRVKGNED